MSTFLPHPVKKNKDVKQNGNANDADNDLIHYIQ